MANEEKLRDYLKRVTTDLAQVRERLREVEERRPEPVAIVGMACRFPGGVSSPGDLWRLLEARGDGIGPFPDNRGWPTDLVDPDPDAAGKTLSGEGGFLYDAADFDAAFFGISPREALAMDPQQRLLLETSWEALEDAGIDPVRLRGSATGVFTGLFYHDYLPSHSMPEEVEGYVGVGATASVASGRVAYSLGFEGPAVTIDTACSSSLVALHLAAQSLRSGESTLALAGGVKVMSTPNTFIDFSRQRAVAVNGRCKSYAEGADGTAWGEGVGVLVVERLSDARRNGHRVLAVVRGSAVNQDGASNGLTAPNGPSQRRVIRAALADAGLVSADVDVVEGHGTGTALGDPIEAQALLATYGQDRAEDRPLLLGSVKSNIGHAQAAAGVAGIIKMIAAMEHGVVPATLHAEVPSSHVDWDAGAVRLVTEAVPWPETGGRPRRAGVSSFGFSGTNAHVIIEAPEAPVEGVEVQGAPVLEGGSGVGLPVVPWVVSGRSAEGLAGQAGRLLGFVGEGCGRADVVDVGWSLVSSRAVLEHRAVVFGGDGVELCAGLGAVVEGAEAPGVVSGVVGGVGRLGLVFTGQGAQRVGMGQGLYRAFPVFAGVFDEVCGVLSGLVGGSVGAVVRGEGEASWLGGGEVDETVWAQCGLFAVEVALFRLLESWGVTPQVVGGHSIGELAAAYVAGVWSLGDACRVVAARGRLMQGLPSGGAMVAVEASEGEVREAIAGRSGVGVAAVNGPRAVVVSGVEDEVLAVVEVLAASGARTRRLRVSHAFHSPLMEPMLAEFGEVVASVESHRPRLVMVSGLTGGVVSDEVTDASYWVRHVRDAVRFADAVEAMRAAGVGTFVEVGPDGVLSGLGPLTRTEDAADTEANGDVVESWTPVLRRGRDEPRAVLTALAKVFVRGVPVAWEKVYAGTGARRVDLPTYAFQRRRYWLGVAAGSRAEDLGLAGPGHALLGASVVLPASGGVVLTGRLALSSQPWLADHAVAGRTVVPGAALVEMVVRAGDEVGCSRIEELLSEAPLVLPAQGGVRVQVAVAEPDDTGRCTFSVYAQDEDVPPEGEWTRHANGVLSAAEAAAEESAEGFRAWPPSDAEPVELGALYPELAARGLDYGPVFQGLRGAWRKGAELYAEVALPSDVSVAGFGLHPALLDSALHVAAADTGDGLTLPFAWNDVTVHASGATAARVRVAPAATGEGLTVTLADLGGGLVATVGRLAVRTASPAELAAGAHPADDALFGVEWVPAAGAAPDGQPQPAGSWAVLGGTAHGAALELPGAAAYPDLPALVAAVGAGAEAPRTVVVRAVPDPAAGGVAAAAHRTAADVLELVRGWPAADLPDETRLLVLTERAVDAGPEAPLDLAAATVWGLVRVAQTEHPGRILLADMDDVSGDAAGRLAAGVEWGEPQFAFRDGQLRVPRLARVRPTAPPTERAGRRGTVLVTGASGVLGGLVARHLARTGQAEHLLLVSRRGGEAAGMPQLLASIEEYGVQATAVACDTADRAQLADVLKGASLTGVVHAAGVLDDGLLATLTPERLAAVLRPKVDAAWNLHELTREMDLDTFVLFSSIAGVVGNAGQANYAAGNTFLDALAAHRHRQGLPAVSLAWGPWENGMVGDLSEADLQRMARQGLKPLSGTRGLAVLDAAADRSEPLLVPAALDPGVLRHSGEVPPLFSGLVRGRTTAQAARRTAGQPAAEDRNALAARLAGLSRAEGHDVLQDLVVTQAALVLGMSGPGSLDADRPFRDVGFDSLTAVELRNRLGKATGLRLPATAVFDYPTPAALAGYALTELVGRLDAADTARPGAAGAATAGGGAVDDDPVAIVGMACRFPGGAASPADFWRMLAAGEDGVGPFPADRGWSTDLVDPDPDAVGKTVSGEGGFLYDAATFDAEFFGVSPREALVMDPQQRLLLETSWEALEDAGIDPAGLHASATGVFTGMFHHDYLSATGLPEEAEGYVGLGATGSVASGRVAYSLGLEGPAVTIDTACSSSLVALHLAAQSLRSGESTLALVSGVNVMSTPVTFIDFSRQRGLASDGRCKAYSDQADGTGWGEGVGVLVVERLSDARRNGHRVLAVVRGSAVNQDGASNGLTAPNGPSQQRVIRAALADAGLTPADVDVVEGHGTGTALGDPIEAQALLATYGRDRPADRPLWLGSVKSNIGHAQAAAGVAGVIKTVLALQHGLVPRTLHADTPSSHVDWDAGAVRLATESVPWPETGGRPRRAGVSSFGFSGTNAHVIIEAPEAPVEGVEVQGAPVLEGGSGVGLPVVPWVVSGRSAEGLAGQAGRLLEFVGEGCERADVVDVGWSLVSSRAVLEHRAVVLGGDGVELCAGLGAVAAGGELPGVVSGVVGGVGRLGLVFTGQGAQRVGMGQGLYRAFPVFAGVFDEVCGVLSGLVGGSVGAVVRGEGEASWLGGGEVDETVWAQCGLFAVEVALFRLLESWGVTPQVVGGHSIGELAAAHVAGVWSLEDACRVVAARGRLMQGLPSGGAMVAVEASEGEVREAIAGRAGVGVAAVNGPRAVVVSGVEDEVLAVAGVLAGAGARTRRLRVSHAFHSPLMEPMLAEFGEVVAAVKSERPRLVMVSGLTGGVVSDEVTDASYWVRHVRDAVRFADAVEAMRGAGVGTFVEVGPDGVLSALGPATRTDAAEAAVESWTPVLRRGRDEPRALLTALSKVFVRGVPVAWEKVYAGTGARRVDLPTYAFQRRRYWLNSAAGSRAEDLGLAAPGHALLGATVDLPASGDTVLTGQLSLSAHPWIGRSTVAGRVVLPAAALLDMAVRAADEVGCDRVEELLVDAPLVLPAQGGARVQVTVGTARADGLRDVAVHARLPEGAWVRHASGTLAPAGTGTGNGPDVGPDGNATADTAPWSAPWPPAGAVPADVEGLYDALAAAGLDYGPEFRGVRAAWRQGDEVFAEIALPEGTDVSGFGVHPALLDASLHLTALAEAEQRRAPDDGPPQPLAWSRVRLHASGATAARLRIAPSASGEGVSVELADPAGRPIASAGSVAVVPLAPGALDQAAGAARDGLFRVAWSVADTAPTSAAPDRPWAVLGDEGGVDLPGAQVYADLAELTAALDAGAPVPGAVVFRGLPDAGPEGEPAAGAAPGPVQVPVPEAARRAAVRTLETLRALLSAPRLDGARLVVVTECGVDADRGTAIRLEQAGVVGLVRTAAAEHPERIVLADVDRLAGSGPLLVAGTALDEPQFAVRDGRVRVPRLARAAGDGPGHPDGEAPGQDPAAAAGETADPAPSTTPGTVLLTGASGALGGLLARHLAHTGRAGRLLLTSRRGPAAPGMARLAADLAAAGCPAQVLACDVADRAQLAAVTAGVPASAPLTGVLHTAGVLDDGVLDSLTPERVDQVMRPKADAAWHLHELTRGLDLDTFVLFSSVAGVLGTPGQANYAAGNTFLDALAAHRRQQGLPAVSLAWGPWEQGMAGRLTSADRRRMARQGVRPLSDADGLALFDAALDRSDPLLVTTRLDPAALRGAGSAVPALLTGLVRPGRRTAGGAGGGAGRNLLNQLAALPAAELRAAVLDLVLTQAALVLGRPGPQSIAAARYFRQLGFDSLTAVEFRNRMSTALGLRLPSAVVFDYPTPAELADHLQERIAQQEIDYAPVHGTLDRLGTMLDGIVRRGGRKADIISRLEHLVEEFRGAEADDASSDEDIIDATDDEMFDLIDKELGIQPGTGGGAA